MGRPVSVQYYRCAACKAEMTIHPQDTKYGQTLRAYVAYLLIEMRLSHQKIVLSTSLPSSICQSSDHGE